MLLPGRRRADLTTLPTNFPAASRGDVDSALDRQSGPVFLTRPRTLRGIKKSCSFLNCGTLFDLNLQVSQALPAAGASNNTASIDTGNANPGRIPNVEMVFAMPATPSLADTKNITLTLQDSADNSSFALVTDIPAKIVTGAGGVGGAGLIYQCKLPIALRRYVRLDAAVDASGGDNTALSYTLGLVF
ncbi:MAG TPA: hypothetical protein VHW03_05230 [Chthoniobacterales bacterium]|jgi:hypothetical protein|nr:hypothetical protein [Chthoniobacterales bacterium]